MNNTTAIGWFIGLSQADGGQWILTAYGKNGLWRLRRVFPTIAEARKARRALIAHHKKMTVKRR